VEGQDDRQRVVLGIAMVSNETQHLRQALGQVVDALKSHPVAEFVDAELDI
jgi:uncharacterized protein YlxP (DUF503 family)